ncbi:hypothetical protein SDC9_68569 [bioreactor metagenome]|uniref:Uncharacterized protein n=1 Tax=bioreactor metagenome TaxID=1076179 RepID=A0A644Y184_9ZZZZ
MLDRGADLVVVRGLRPGLGEVERLADRVGHRVLGPDLRVVVRGLVGRRVAVGDEVVRLVLRGHDAGDRVERQVRMLAPGANAQHDAPEGRCGRFVGLHPRVERPAHVIEQRLLDGALLDGALGGRVDERPVDHERAVGALPVLHGHVLVLGGDAGAAQALRPDRADDPGRLLTSGAVEPESVVGHRRRGILEDALALRFVQGVDPHRHRLRADPLHTQLLAGLLGRRHQLVPGDRLAHVESGLCGDRLLVPEQLGVGPERDGGDLPLPGGCLDGALDGVLGRRRGQGCGDGGQETGLGEFGHEGWVQAHDVQGGVAGGEPAGQLLALRTRVAGQQGCLDGVPPARSGGAPLGDLGLTAVVRIDVPGESGGAGPLCRRATAHGRRRRECGCCDHRECSPSPSWRRTGLMHDHSFHNDVDRVASGGTPGRNGRQENEISVTPHLSRPSPANAAVSRATRQHRDISVRGAGRLWSVLARERVGRPRCLGTKSAGRLPGVPATEVLQSPGAQAQVLSLCSHVRRLRLGRGQAIGDGVLWRTRPGLGVWNQQPPGRSRRRASW